jgi:hypothetical protein
MFIPLKSIKIFNRVKFQTSLSQPSPSIESKPSARRHLTLPEPLNNNNNYYPQSRAELYVLARSQMLSQANEQKDLSPETPLSITASSIHPFQLNLTHTELMNNWYQKKTYELRKKRKHGYVYGVPPKSPLTSPIGLGFTFPPSTQLLSQQSDIQSGKKDNLTDRSKTNESRSKLKLSSAV